MFSISVMFYLLCERGTHKQKISYFTKTKSGLVLRASEERLALYHCSRLGDNRKQLRLEFAQLVGELKL